MYVIYNIHYTIYIMHCIFYVKIYTLYVPFGNAFYFYFKIYFLLIYVPRSRRQVSFVPRSRRQCRSCPSAEVNVVSEMLMKFHGC